ncbi:ABC transporter [Dokdonia pacifica]|uniref:ATP-binding cassette, subfamily B n=1 Tax=Dokdonia pacifica TaxID=1627892 RepID=A0A239AS68_9FLAO|nr:ABC transporter ATP-binding protein [Dokdonia pacifica]GGG31523.1 ABC transporter [Dokdonia pacifica]SNR98390.1 ATP-binding cassette, subfamily B [Dokdonia pacifica]
MKALKSLNHYFLRYKWRLIIGIFTIIAARFFAVTVVTLVGKSVKVIEAYLKTEITTTQFENDLQYYLLLLLGAVFLSGFFTFLMRQLIIVVSRYIEADLKDDIYAQYQRLSLGFYKKNRTGDLMNRISEDVGKVRMYIGPAIMYMLTALVLFATVIPYMYTTATSLTLYTLIPLPILSIAIYKLSREIHKRSTIVQEYLSKLTTFTQESFSGISVIKAYTLEGYTQQGFTKLSDDSKNKNLDLVKVQAFFFPLMIGLIGSSNLLVIYIGGNQYINDQIKLETLIEFIMFVNMLTWPVATVGWVTSIIKAAEASQIRINEFLKIEPEIQNTIETKTPIQGEITFDNVSFTYEDTNITALKNVSFSIQKGQTLAIIGRTGSGKSTILELIGRLYEVTSGEIRIDNTPIQDLNLDNLRASIGYVPQDAFLFSDSIKENIKFGAPNATDEEVISYAKAAVVHQNIAEFKEGYDTILGERGITLSGGQKQRVSIARALISKPKLILLDDSLSAVDTETEEQILENLDQTSKNTTTIIVSHRISSAKNADQIIILNEGQITQQGTHNQLIKEEGYYKELYLKQLDEKEM